MLFGAQVSGWLKISSYVADPLSWTSSQVHCMQLQTPALVRLQEQPCSVGSRVLAQGERGLSIQAGGEVWAPLGEKRGVGRDP